MLFHLFPLSIVFVEALKTIKKKTTSVVPIIGDLGGQI
jgi:hypothetical protein